MLSYITRLCKRLSLTTSPGAEARASAANAHLHLGRAGAQDRAAPGGRGLWEMESGAARRASWESRAGASARSGARAGGAGGGACAARPEVAAAAAGGGERGRRSGTPRLWSFLWAGRASRRFRTRDRSWIAVGGGKPRYHHGNRQPAGRVTSPLAPLGAASAGGSRGVLKGGAPRRLGAGGSAPIPRTALFFCSGLGGRTGAGPAPLASFQLYAPATGVSTESKPAGRACRCARRQRAGPGRLRPDSRGAPQVFLIRGRTCVLGDHSGFVQRERLSPAQCALWPLVGSKDLLATAKLRFDCDACC